jgi:hypothetical protein
LFCGALFFLELFRELPLSGVPEDPLRIEFIEFSLPKFSLLSKVILPAIFFPAPVFVPRSIVTVAGGLPTV